MLFNSLPFLLLLAVSYGAWSLSRGAARVHVLLVASYLFYASWNPLYLPLLLFSTFLDFEVARRLDATDSPGGRRLLLGLSLAGNFGVLAYFKYWNFFLSSLGLVEVDPTLQTFHVYGHVPPGLSFYTFQTLSYTFDVYRRQTRHCRSLSEFALYVAFFPQLMAGPILRSHEFLPQLAREREPTPEETTQGVELFMLGLFKKVVVADNLGLMVDAVFQDPWRWSGPSIGIAAALFWIQVYCDFSGYSTMARGLGRLFGFQMPLNFDYPLLATDPLAYRRSWHITMSRWFRDYVYHPLGGGRRGSWRVAWNILLVWTLFGLWHGAAWTFVMWGAYNGVIQAANRERLRRGWTAPEFPGRAFAGWLVNLALVLPSALIFRASSLGEGLALAERMLRFGAGEPAPGVWWAILGILASLHLLARLRYRENLLASLSPAARAALLAAVTALMLAGGAAQRPFVYFQF